MDIKYINPFIESILENIEKMTQIKAEKQQLSVSKNEAPFSDISGIIGLGGEVRGSAVISFPKDLALAVASAMFMEELSEINDEVKDAIGEFANIIVGNARNKLVNAGLQVQISTPTIIVGKNHEIVHPDSVPFLVIPFKTVKGILTINVGIKENK
jgi:chemotaxis protein CheX